MILLLLPLGEQFSFVLGELVDALGAGLLVAAPPLDDIRLPRALLNVDDLLVERPLVVELLLALFVLCCSSNSTH